MINGRVSRIDESLRISKHFVLNGLQQTEREAGDLHTNAFHYLDTFFFWLLFTVPAMDFGFHLV